jgi:protein TonB
MLLLVSVLAQALQGAELTEPSKPSEPFVITAPPWRNRATGEDVGRVYPRDALRKGIEARATVECRVAADGRMSDCALVSVEPAGLGFEEAALKLTPRFRMHLTTPDGTSVVGGTIRMPLRFSLPR